MIKNHNLEGLEVLSCEPAKKTSYPPVLFIHGAFAGAWMWADTFMPYLAEAGYPSYALSLRGHAGSHGAEYIDWYSIADYLEDLTHVINWLEETPVLVGHSMGGFVVQKYLENNLPLGAALICSVPPQGLVAAQLHMFLRKPTLLMEINRIMGGSPTETDTLREALFAGEVDKKMLHTWLSRMQKESFQAIWDMSIFNLPKIYAMRRPPMLILGAEKDELIPDFLVESTAIAYGQPAKIFEGMGHAVTHEKKWPLVAATLKEWLDKIRL